MDHKFFVRMLKIIFPQFVFFFICAGFVFVPHTFARVVFDQAPPNEIAHGAILNSPQFVSFGCTLNLDCKVAGQKIYNVGVWMKKVGSPRDVRLRLTSTFGDVVTGTVAFSNSVSASSISDTYYTLKWFYFPDGVVMGARGDGNQFFEFQFADVVGEFSGTDFYMALYDTVNDYTASQQWCEIYRGCYSSPFYFRLDDSPENLSLVTPTESSPHIYTGNIFSQTDSAEIYTSKSDINVMQSIGKGNSGTIQRVNIKIGQDSDYEWNGSYSITLHDMGTNNVYSGSAGCYLKNPVPLQFLSKGLADRDIIFDDTTVTCWGGMTLALSPEHYYTFQIMANAVNGTNYTLSLAGSSSGSPCAPVYLTNTTNFPGNLRSVFMQVDGINSSSTPVCPAQGSNILFLPGIEASRLYREKRADEGGGVSRLWEPLSNTDVEYMFLGEDGRQIDSPIGAHKVFTKDVVDEVYLAELGPNIYKSFLAELDSLKQSGTIADYSAVPYDWRLSLDDIVSRGTKDAEGNISYTDDTSSPYIISELRRLTETSKTGKVTIVAHSNGGLVTKALIKKLADAGDPLAEKIDKIIFVAVPQVGTPQAIPALLHGTNQAIPASFLPLAISEHTARELGHNMQSAYNLLPSANYFTYVDNPVVMFASSTSDWADKYGDVIHSRERLHNFLVGDYGRVSETSGNVSLPDSLSETLLTEAEAVHDSLDNWTAPSGTKVYEIAGWGVPSTMSGLVYQKGRCYSLSCGFLKMTVKPVPEWTIDGDGTVVVPSALWMPSGERARQSSTPMRASMRLEPNARSHRSLLTCRPLSHA